MEERRSNIEEIIERDGQILEMPVGVSMWPMLKNRRDAIVIQKVARPLKTNDVVLYKRSNNRYVLHRIIRIDGDSLVIRGDNCDRSERDVKTGDVIGVLQGFYKGKRYIDCDRNRGYKIYVFLCRATYLPRIPVRKAFRIIKAICSRVMTFKN